MSPLILAVIVFVTTLCAQTDAAQSKAAPPKAVPAQAQNTNTPNAAAPNIAARDKEIEELIRTKLAKSKIGKDGFKVRVQGGVAYWDGATGVVQHKGAATRMAKTAGADRVVNNIKISGSTKEAATATTELGPRRVQVKRGDARSESAQ